MPECVGNYSIPTAHSNVEGADTLAGAGILNFWMFTYSRPPLMLLIILSIILGFGVRFPQLYINDSYPNCQFAGRCEECFLFPTCLWRWNRQSVTETSAYKIQTPGNYPEENIQRTEHGKSLKSRSLEFFWECCEKKTEFIQNYRHPCRASNLAPLEYMIDYLQLESHYSVIHFACQHSIKLHEDRIKTVTHESLKCTVHHFAQCDTEHRLVYWAQKLNVVQVIAMQS